MTRRLPRTALVGVFLLAGPAVGQELDTSAIDAVFEDFDNSDTPGCALGVVIDGRLAYARGYGMANLEHGLAITPRTVFRTGSVAKQFTAATIALAARDGHLDLDDEIQDWLPYMPRYEEPVTVRHLVHHTSGLRDYLVLMRLRGLRNEDFYSEEELLEVQSRQQELNFPPGSEYLYSNSGYFLLGEILWAATGESLKDYAQRKIFMPLGMSHSHFHDDHTHVVPGRADGYAPTGGGGYRISMTTLEMVGDGGVFTSVEDLVPWVNALAADGLGPGTTEMLETRAVLGSGEQIAYAFGQRVDEYRGLRTVGHGGAFVGFRADILRFPTENTSFITLCNRADASPSAHARRVANVVLADRLGPPPAPAQRNAGQTAGRETAGPIADPGPYLGTYYSPELDVHYAIEHVEGEVRVRAGAGIDLPLMEIEPDRLRAGGLTFRFERSGGRVTGFELDAGRVQHVAFERVNGSGR